MPYINQSRRNAIDNNLGDPENCGELNYKITTAILDYLNGKVSYSKINEVIGVLECVKLEFYRRLASPYENEKINENGDIDDYKSR